MNRKSVIKHILAEAVGNPILVEQYELQDIIAPIIKEMRGLISQAQQKFPTIKSIALKIESGKLERTSLDDVKKIWLDLNHIFTKIFKLRNEMQKEMKESFGDEPMPQELAKLTVSDSYRYISNAQAMSRRAFKHCCFESADSTIEDAEMCEHYMDELSKVLYQITKGMLY